MDLAKMQARSRSNVNPQPLLFWLYRTSIAIDTRLLTEFKCMNIESKKLSEFICVINMLPTVYATQSNLKRAPFHA